MLKAVIDTNVFVSATITGKGKPGQILKAWRENELEVIISPGILREIGKVIFKPKIKKISFWTDKERYELIKDLAKICILTPGSSELEKVVEHTPDHKFLVAAIEGKADYIVSGDYHLRDLRAYKGVKIVSPTEFLQILEGKK
jgi:hypothetical protein